MNDPDAYAAAVRLLSASDKTPGELSRRLSEKGFDASDVSAALARLSAEGFLNEERLARRTVEKLYEKYYGPSYIEEYVKRKEFSEEAVRYVRSLCGGIDFNAKAKEFVREQLASGKTKAAALSALYRRGFEIE